MSFSWERRLAENITNADHMRDVRKRIDMEHEERLRRREHEREDAEVSRATRKVKTPSASVKFKIRSYDRPWAVTNPETRKTSPSFTKSSSSESSPSSSRSSGSRLPDITNRAQRQSSETRTPQTTQRYHRHNKHAENKYSNHKDKCVRAKIRKSLPSGRSACHQGVHGQFTSSDTETSPCSFAQNKPPLVHSRGALPVSQVHRFPRAWPLLPSLRYTSSSSESDSGQQDTPDRLLDFSDIDSSIPDEEPDDSEGPNSSIFSACSVSTDSCLSSAQQTESSLGYPSSSGSSSSTSSRDTVLDLSPRLRVSPLEWLSRDLPSLEPITSESDEEDLEEEWNTWQTRQLGQGGGLVRWRGPLSRPYPAPAPAPLAAAAAGASSRRDVEASVSRDVSPRGPAVRRSLDRDVYSSMPGLEPIPGITLAGDISASAARNHRAGLYLSLMEPPGLEPIPRNEPPWLGWLRRPGAASLQASAQDRDGENHSSGEGEESVTPPPVAPRLGSRVEALAVMDQLGMALMAMRQMRREIQEMQRNNGHEGASLPRRNNTESGNSTRNGNSASVDGSNAGAPDARPQADPETLRRITQSLMEESDDEEEGDQCRICQSGAGTPTNPLLCPCQCSGSLQYIHHDCLKKWIQTKIESGADMPAVTTCELCKGTLNLDLDDFDLEECFRRHAQTQRDRGGPDLHLLLLLQERFSDLMMAIQAHSVAVTQDLRQRGEPETVTDRSTRRRRGTVTATTGRTSDSSSESPL